VDRANLAGRAGRWSAEHWKLALFGWLAFAVVAMALGNVVGHVQMKDSQAASGEAARALAMLDRAHFEQPAVENVLIQSRRWTVEDEPMIQAIAAVIVNLDRQRNVTDIQDPRTTPGGGQISRDGHSVLIQFTVRGDPDKAKGKIAPILAAVASAQSARPEVSIREVGTASWNYEVGKAFNQDFANAERLTIPITLIILLVAFGALVAAGLPVVLAFSAVLASLGLYALFTHLTSGDYETTSSVILLIGMAVGIDYSLFYLRREREERAAGREPRAALLRAAATSGQAVLISGITVLIAMSGMLIASNRIFTSIAFGTMFVVLSAMIGSLTVLPAALARLGDRVDRGRIPFLGRKRSAGESRFWGYVLGRVLRRPVVALLLAGGLLVAAASPALSLQTKLPSYSDMPQLPIIKTYEAVIAAFPGAPTPADVVISAPDVRAPSVQSAIEDLERSAAATGQMFRPMLVLTSRDHTVADVQIPIAGTGDDAVSLAALHTLRSKVLPATLGRSPARPVYAVTGETAGTHDFNRQMVQRLPYVFAFVLGLAFLLLLATFRSVVIPLTSIVLNLLSVGACYGLLVLVFQHGWGRQLLGFTGNHAIASFLPLFMFVVLFGLSMDYNVFILSRIKELRESGLSTEEAIALGIRRTAGTVTSAAIIMVAVFAIFGTLRMISMKQMGVGLGLAVLIDATIIRGVLLPATMKLLGDWNWYMPRWLSWVPKLTPEDRLPQGPGRTFAAPGH
jgi:RND superfamily putative drug exporter